ncbi:MAG: flagellar hook protein FlgE [Bacillota bacterium]
MLRSMYAGVSGLNTHQQMMDVTGNNISNVNTVGFKSSRVTFKEMLSQTIQGASASNPEQNRAGTNPMQIGLGVGLGSIDNDMSSGNLQSTGKTSDVAIQGDGFFVLEDGENDFSYSRAGNFGFDGSGFLYSLSTGLRVMGKDGPIKLDPSIDHQETTAASIAGRLSAEAEENDTKVITTDIVSNDDLSYTLELTFDKTSEDDEWSISGGLYDGDNLLGGVTLDTTLIEFDGDGDISAGSEIKINDLDTLINKTDPITLDLSSLRQLGDQSSANFSDVDGQRLGTIESFSFNEIGEVIGSYSNGESKTSDQIQLAVFENPAGLERKDGVFKSTPNSSPRANGDPKFTFSGDGDGAGSLAPATLEMSNANLSQEFTNMITAQRGFQASSKLITTSDEMLQELVNLKR